jgi:DNA mismatch endonuclease, patch repair protein
MNQRTVKSRDPLTVAERSVRMAKVRGKGNRSTELSVAACLIRSGIRGWKRHCSEISGRPDFYFPHEGIAVFVDGCFWHGCPSCKRNVPHARRQFWTEKINTNKRRDRTVTARLRLQGRFVIRIWEHAVPDRQWLSRLRRALNA